MVAPVVLGAGLMAGASAAQGLITSGFNAWQASKQERFQERMSNTSHQREVRDLRAAGLNPVLSAKLGGASTPSGAAGSAEVPDIARAGAQGAALKSQIENTEANTALAHAQAGDVNATQRQRIDQMISQARLNREIAHKTGVDELKSYQEIRNLESQKKKLDLESSHSAYDLNRAKSESDFYKNTGSFAPYLDRAKDYIPGGGPLLDGARKLFRKRASKKILRGSKQYDID